MADRSAAQLFGEIFTLIRKHVPKKERKEVALRYWDKMQDYDFQPHQMCCDSALVKLGLAEERVNLHGDEFYVYFGDENEDNDE